MVKMLSGEQKREKWVDCAKGIGIVFVVLGHAIDAVLSHGIFSSGEVLLNSFYNAIYSFHMPLLFFLSGYLFANHSRNKTRKAVNITLLYFTISIIYICLRLAFQKYIYSEVNWLQIVLLPIKPQGPYWYIWVLALYYFLFDALCRILSPRVLWILALLTSLGADIVYNCKLLPVANNVYQLLFYGVFFYCGMRYTMPNMRKLFCNMFFAGLPSILLLCYLLKVTTGYVQFIPVVNMLVAAGLVVFFVSLSQLCANWDFVISVFGKKSLGIYLWHAFFVTAIASILGRGQLNGVVATLVICFGGIAGSLLIMYLLRIIGVQEVLTSPLDFWRKAFVRIREK